MFLTRFIGPLRSLSLRVKLVAAVGSLLAMICVVAGLSFRTTKLLANSVYALSAANSAADFLGQAAASKPEMLQYIWVAVAGYDMNAPVSESQIKDFMEPAEMFQNNLMKYALASPLTGREKELYDTADKNWSAIRALVESLAKEMSLGKIAKAEVMARANLISEKSLGVGDSLSEISGIVRQSSTVADTAARELERRSKMISVVLMALAALIGAAVLWLVHQLVGTITGIAATLAKRASAVESTAEQIAAAGQSLAGSSTEQAAAVEETTVSMGEILKTVTENTLKAKRAEKLSKDGLNQGNASAQQNQALIQSMTEVNASSREIETIVDVIDDIAFQTNLLALNASVEAARAGEHGRGFAVVADAVRALAQKSAKSAKEIGTLMQESRGRIDNGSSAATSSSDALQVMLTGLGEMSELNISIAGGSQEQEEMIRQIERAMEQIDIVTQQGASTAEQVAAAADDLSSQATDLNQSVQTLSHIIYGAKAS